MRLTKDWDIPCFVTAYSSLLVIQELIAKILIIISVLSNVSLLIRVFTDGAQSTLLYILKTISNWSNFSMIHPMNVENPYNKCKDYAIVRFIGKVYHGLVYVPVLIWMFTFIGEPALWAVLRCFSLFYFLSVSSCLRTIRVLSTLCPLIFSLSFKRWRISCGWLLLKRFRFRF